MTRDFSDLFDLSRPLAALSPMAGFTTLSYRAICRRFGADYCPSELTSARSVVMNGVNKSFRFMAIDKEREGVTCIQLFGDDPDDFPEAMKIICDDERLSQVDIFDINMGCPVPKVLKAGAGSGLIRTPETACNIVKKARQTAEKLGKALTVKTRIGFDLEDSSGPSFAHMLAQSGAQAICVHGRYAKQMYQGRADWEKIRLMREAVREDGVYFLANGDVTDVFSARGILEATGADGLMIGRAAMGNPWIFDEVRSELDGNYSKIINKPVTLRQKCDMLLEELAGREQEAGQRVAVTEMRSVMPHYIKGFPGAAKVKNALCKAASSGEIRQILNDYIEEVEADGF